MSRKDMLISIALTSSYRVNSTGFLQVATVDSGSCFGLSKSWGWHGGGSNFEGFLQAWKWEGS